MGETLKSIYATWESYAKEHKVPKNPINWTEHHVLLWLQWTMDEFHFGGFTIEELVAEFKVSNNHFYKITINNTTYIVFIIWKGKKSQKTKQIFRKNLLYFCLFKILTFQYLYLHR